MSVESERLIEQNRASRQARVHERAAARMVILGAAPDLLGVLGLWPGQAVKAPTHLSTGWIDMSTGLATAQARRRQDVAS